MAVVRILSAVQLTHRQQVEGRHQQAKPGRKCHRTEVDIHAVARQPLVIDQQLEQAIEQRIALLQTAAAADDRPDRRSEQADDQQRQGHDQAGERSDHRDIEQGAAILHR